MIDSWIQWPLTIRLAGAAALGLVLGSQINRAIYRLAFRQRDIGPWSPASAEAPQRRWWDRVPAVGWLGLRREASLHGRWFWVRPLLIEIWAAVGLAALYWWEVDQQGLLPRWPGMTATAGQLHCWFLAHALLLSALSAATFIDFDEQTIPDAITIPGTLAALLLAACLPGSLPPDALANVPSPGQFAVQPLTAAPQGEWPPQWDQTRGLWIGWGCWLAWVLAVSPRARWTARRGLLRGVRYQAVSLVRYGSWRRHPLLGLLGAAALAGVWTLGGPAWRSLLTAVIGTAFGGALVWSVRIVAGSALGREAMGFGDVTLMAMIGAYLGWQATIVVFFLAPFAAIFISVARLLISRDRQIAFGPFLALATLLLIVDWRSIWFGSVRDVFAILGPIVPTITLFAIMAMGGMLLLWRAIERRLTGSAVDEEPAGDGAAGR